MKTRTKFLALVMVCIMLLGVVAMVIPASAGFDQTFDIRKADEYLESKDTENTYEDIYYSYVTHRVATYATTAPTVDGTVGTDEYTLANESLTRTYTTGANFELGAGVTIEASKEYVEYFAQDANYIYMAFELPGFAETVTFGETATASPIDFDLFYNADHRIDSNRNLFGMWSTGRLDINTAVVSGVATTTVAAAGNGGLYDSTKLPTTEDYAVAFKAPTTEDTSAYFEFKITKAAFAAFFKQAKVTDVSYIIRYGSTDDKVNFISNAMPSKEIGNAVFAGSNEFYKQIAKNIDFTPVDVKYDLDEYGYADYEVDEKIATAPTVDGAVAASEYSLEIATAANDAKHNQTSKNVKEYFAWDDNYLYYAATIEEFTGAGPVYVRIFTDPSGLAGPSWFNAIQVQFNKDAKTGAWSGTMAGGRNNERDHYDKVSNTGRFGATDDVVANAKMDGTTLVVEFKIDLMELTWCHKPGNADNTAVVPYNNFRFILGGAEDGKYIGNVLDADTQAVLKAIDPHYTGTVIGRSVSYTGPAIPAITTEAPATTAAPEATAAPTTVAATTAAPLTFDIRKDMPSIFVGAAATTAPAQDGAVGTTEYSYSRFIAADAALRGSSDTTEYFAYDADYVYMAVVIEDADAAKDKSLYMCFWTADDGRAGAAWFNRGQFCVTIAADGTSTFAENGRRNNKDGYVTPSTGKNGSAVGTGKFDDTAKTAVYEFKFKRTELAELFKGTEAVENFRYTWFTLDENMAGHVVKADSAEGLKIKENDGSMTGQTYTFGINVNLKAAGTGDLAIAASTKPAATTAAPETTAAPVTTAAPETTDAPATTKAPATTVAPTEAPDTTEAPATTEAAKKGCKGSLTVSALALLPIIAGGVVIARKRED